MQKDETFELMKKKFEFVEEFKTSKCKYIVGYAYNERYLLSKGENYILSKLVNHQDLYVAVSPSYAEILDILMKIANREPIYPNEKAKFVSKLTGIGTI